MRGTTRRGITKRSCVGLTDKKDPFSVEQAIAYMKAYRTVFRILNKEWGIEKRSVWIKAGWNGNFDGLEGSEHSDCGACDKSHPGQLSFTFYGWQA
jgi:hypothetical protein